MTETSPRDARAPSCLPAVVAAVALALLPPPANAQECACDAVDHEPYFTLQLRSGTARYGRFLEDRVPEGERELTATGGLALGLAAGYSPSDDTVLQGNVSWIRSTLEYEDDTPGGAPALGEEVGDIAVLVLSAEIRRHLVDDQRTVAPYTIVGLSLAWWSLDGATGGVTDHGERPLRYGGVGGLGVDVRLRDGLKLQLELSNYRVGSPFDGDDGFGIGGEVFDESNSLNVREFTVGLNFVF